LGSASSSLPAESDLQNPEGSVAVPPLWRAPSPGSNINFNLPKYVTEYISTTLSIDVQGRSLSIDTASRKLAVRSGDQVLGVAKKTGKSFRICCLHPIYEGQKACGKLQRAGNAPLYFHTKVERNRKNISVYQMKNKKLYEIQSQGSMNSFEKVCTNSATAEDCAVWRYHNQQNRVEIFQNNDGSDSAIDVALIMLLVVIADIFDMDAMMDKAGVAAIVG
jgi:hypothetical protein